VLSYETLKIMHRHDQEWVPMTDTTGVRAHDPAFDDPERSWWRGDVRIFRCSTCAEEIAIDVPGRGDAGAGAEGR
jgi:hypothetical protein